jgi:hypothetical protein
MKDLRLSPFFCPTLPYSSFVRRFPAFFHDYRDSSVTPYPGHEWTEQQARNATMEEWGFLRGCGYLLHDRDTKFCASFRELIESGSIKTIRLPARSPNLNSFAERWVRSVKRNACQG